MKKLFFILCLFALASTNAFAANNAVSSPEILNLAQDELITDVKNFSTEEDITICYEMSRTSRSINEFLAEVTIEYLCFDHPGVLGTGTVYMNSK